MNETTNFAEQRSESVSASVVSRQGPCNLAKEYNVQGQGRMEKRID